jgi:hypothetical protein
MPYKDDVEEMIFRRRTEITELQDKCVKYQQKTEDEISARLAEITILEEIAPTLPEKQPHMFKMEG